MENRILFSLSSRVTAFRRSDFCCEKLLFFTKTIRNVLLMKQRYTTASVFSVPAETNTWKNTIFQTAERYSTLFIPCTPKTEHIHVAPPHSYLYIYLHVDMANMYTSFQKSKWSIPDDRTGLIVQITTRCWQRYKLLHREYLCIWNK